jgi:hypothetical protein
MGRAGVPHAQIATSLGISIHTVRLWLGGRVPHDVRVQLEPELWCGACAEPAHDFSALPLGPYRYLLGFYLGDGNIFGHSRHSYSLRLSMDSRYGGIVHEVYQAVTAVRGRPPRYQPIRGAGLQLVSYWRSWPCVFPQHGRGRKHSRRIHLAEWQREIVAADPRPFLRGLIHSDGWRGLNRVRVKGRNYIYPRYQFSNRSQDIKDLFCWACDLLEVEWRPWARHHISVARRASVARLDEFIGPKR